MAKKTKTVKHRIPFDTWINSQLSVARHYGACIINGKRFVFDPEAVKAYKAAKERGEDVKLKPDLVTFA